MLYNGGGTDGGSGALASELIRKKKLPTLPGQLAPQEQMNVASAIGAPMVPKPTMQRGAAGAGGGPVPQIAPPQAMEPQAPPLPVPPPAIAPPVAPPVALPQVAPVNAPAPGDYMTQFGPGNDLQGTQINATPTQRLQQTQQGTDAAQKALTAQPGFTGFQGVASAPAADTARARELAGQGLEGLIGAPSRQDLALGTYDRLEQSSLADAKAAERQAFQRNAAGGRLGSGMLDEDVGDIFGQRKLKLADARAGLASDTAGLELDDRLKKLSATQDVGSQFEGQDLNRRNEGREERATQRDFETGDLNRARNLLSDQSGIEQQQIGNERANRDEIRGERGFQTDRSDKAQQDRIQQKMLEDSLTNSQFGRDLDTSNFEARQAGVTQDQADQSGQAGEELIQELLRSPEGQGLTAEDIRRLLAGG